MVHDKRNIRTGYEESFDVARFEYIAGLAKAGKGTTELSDVECFLYSIMRGLLFSGENHRE